MQSSWESDCGYHEFNELMDINFVALDEIDILSIINELNSKDPVHNLNLAAVMDIIEEKYDNTKLTNEDYPELKGDIFEFIGTDDFVDYLRIRYKGQLHINEVSSFVVHLIK